MIDLSLFLPRSITGQDREAFLSRFESIEHEIQRFVFRSAEIRGEASAKMKEAVEEIAKEDAA